MKEGFVPKSKNQILYVDTSSVFKEKNFYSFRKAK